MKKVIIVDSGCGRVGSSALMGLLNLAKINVGNKHSKRTNCGDSLNQKGYFEPPSIKKFIEKNYPGYFPGVKFPTIGYIKSKGSAGWAQFSKLIYQEFGSTYPIALKSCKCFVLPYFHEMCIRDDKLKVFVLHLIRNRVQQVQSIQRMWNANKEVIRRRGWGLHPRFINKVCSDWDVFSQKVYAYYNNFTYTDVYFDDLIYDPKICASKIFKFLKHRKPSNRSILRWIDPKLVTT